jgi:hypothetical protein
MSAIILYRKISASEFTLKIRSGNTEETQLSVISKGVACGETGSMIYFSVNFVPSAAIFFSLLF